MKLTTTPFRRLVGVSVLAVSLSSLAACGSNDASVTDPAATSAPTSSAAPSAPTTSSTGGTGSTISGADFVAVYQKAIEQATTAHVALSVDSAAGMLQGSGVEDFTGDTPSAQFTLAQAVAGQKLTVVLADGVAYVQSPTADGKYFKLDLRKALGGGPDLFDPSTTLPILQKYITTASDLGTADVDGRTLHHYSVTLDAQGALKLLSGGTSLPTSAVPSSIDVQTYIDSDGNLARQVVDEGSKLGSSTIDYTQWGAPVTITVPKASQVTTLPASLPTSRPTS